MAQSDWGTIDSSIKTGTQLAVDLNNGKDAWVSNNIGSSRPTYMTASLNVGGTWVKNLTSTAWEYNLWDGVEDVTLFTINSATHKASLATDVVDVSGDIIMGGDLSLTQDQGTIKVTDAVGTSTISNLANDGNLMLDAPVGFDFRIGNTSKLILQTGALRPPTSGALNLGTDTYKWDEGNFSGNVHVAPAWDFDPTTGTPPHGDADNFVIAHDTTKVGMSLLGASASNCYIYFGDTDSTTRGRIVYTNATAPAVDALTFTSGGTQVYEVNGTTIAMTINADTTIDMVDDLNVGADITLTNSTNLNMGNGGKVRFWNSSTSHELYMSASHTDIAYGGVTSYAIINKMNSSSGYGFLWINHSGTPYMSLSSYDGTLALVGELLSAKNARYVNQTAITTSWDITDEPSVVQTAGADRVVNITNQALNSNGVYTLTFGGTLYTQTFTCTGGAIKWAGGSTPTWAINKTYIISAYCYDGTNIYLSAVGEDL